MRGSSSDCRNRDRGIRLIVRTTNAQVKPFDDQPHTAVPTHRLLAASVAALPFPPAFARSPSFARTLAPSRRASLSPIAIACLRLFTFLPDRPDVSVPCLPSCIARFTLLCAFFPYLAIHPPALITRGRRVARQVPRDISERLLDCERPTA